MNQNGIRVVIVDDEPAARRGLRRLMEAYDRIEIVGELQHGGELIDQIDSLNPDLVLLDIQMPECDGFEAISLIGPEKMPPVIFITAYDQFAIKAFEIHAFDYLLKPVDKTRFKEAITRAISSIETQSDGERVKRLENMIADARPPSPQDRFVVKGAGRIYFVNGADIDWVESAGNYVVLHAGGREHLIRSSMTDAETRLAAHQFVRVSRSSLINLDKITEFQPLGKGVYDVVLQNGRVIRTSRHFARNLSFLT